jgi:hypothetical protein
LDENRFEEKFRSSTGIQDIVLLPIDLRKDRNKGKAASAPVSSAEDQRNPAWPQKKTDAEKAFFRAESGVNDRAVATLFKKTTHSGCSEFFAVLCGGQ